MGLKPAGIPAGQTANSLPPSPASWAADVKIQVPNSLNGPTPRTLLAIVILMTSSWAGFVSQSLQLLSDVPLLGVL